MDWSERWAEEWLPGGRSWLAVEATGLTLHKPEDLWVTQASAGTFLDKVCFQDSLVACPRRIFQAGHSVQKVHTGG